MYACTLTKVCRNDLPGGLRTDAVAGFTNCLPREGKRFELIGKALGTHDFLGLALRSVTTSPVEKIGRHGEDYILITQSGSVYKVTIERGDCPEEASNPCL